MYIFDVEADGIYPSKLHCLSIHNLITGESKSTTSYSQMREFFTKADTLIGHNIILWDVPQVERLLDIKVEARLIDTLSISWYAEPSRVRHGLEGYGEDFGIPKPVIKDWDSLTPEEYIYRCEEDVKINKMLWGKQWKFLKRLYGSEEEAYRFIEYLTFKMDCAREQEKRKWKLDVDKAERVLHELTSIKESKVRELASIMPKVPVISRKTRPKKPFKQDGSPSATGIKWFDLLAEKGLPESYSGEVEVITSYKEPNPGSTPQIKSWLHNLGWSPGTFEYKRDKETGDVKPIPQINLKHGAGICPSIKKLYKLEPGLEVLGGLSILTNRISILRGFLANLDEDGFIKAQIQGFTNTLRFRHKTVANLPGVYKPYGEEIRGCLIAPEGYELLGSDMSSLEDRTKQHYMWGYDPEYVKEMLTDDFDPHVDIAVSGNLMSEEDAYRFKNADEEFKHTKVYSALKSIRHTAKQTNYSCVYGAGGATVGRAAGVTTKEGEKLVEAYWERNWSVKAIADDCVVKTCGGTKWLYNPVSKFWYSLRYEKDRFSTLNQGTGVYCFDTWVKKIRSRGLPIIGQMHDEIIGLVRVGLRDKATQVCKWAVQETNKELKLNRDLDCDIDFGDSYAEIH